MTSRALSNAGRVLAAGRIGPEREKVRLVAEQLRDALPPRTVMPLTQDEAVNFASLYCAMVDLTAAQKEVDLCDRLVDPREPAVGRARRARNRKREQMMEVAADLGIDTQLFARAMLPWYVL